MVNKVWTYRLAVFTGFNVVNSIAYAQAQTSFPVGSTVLASPIQLQSVWKRCLVKKTPQGYSGYELECADEVSGASDKMIRLLRAAFVPASWVKADDPKFRPDMQIAAIRAEMAAKSGTISPGKAAVVAGAAGAGMVVPSTVRTGAYECWAFNRPRLLLNFTVTGSGKYTASDGSKSTFNYDAATGQVSFNGYLKDSMPAGYTTVYHEPKGMATVSFRSARAVEVSFCEHV